MDALATVLKPDAVVVADNAMASYYGALGNLPVHAPGGFCFPTGFGTLGYAVPARWGGGRRPGRPVVALTGDGGLMFRAGAGGGGGRRVALPVVVFVNGGYGEIRAQMRTAGIAPMAVAPPVPNLWTWPGHSAASASTLTDRPTWPRSCIRALHRPAPSLLVVDEPGEYQ